VETDYVLFEVNISKFNYNNSLANKLIMVNYNNNVISNKKINSRNPKDINISDSQNFHNSHDVKYIILIKSNNENYKLFNNDNNNNKLTVKENNKLKNLNKASDLKTFETENNLNANGFGQDYILSLRT